MAEAAAARILLPGGLWMGPGVVRFAEGRIVAVDERVVPEGGTLTPGLIDLHNNGCFGVDFATASPAEWQTALTGLAASGVTAVQPTVITAPLPDILPAMGRIAAAAERGTSGAARVIGAHLEGPFLADTRRGAHRADWLLDASPAALDRLLQDPATARILRTITLAPERTHGLAAVRRLAEAGIVVSLGHSDATAEEARAATEAGATMVTHVFNAMRPFGHREPGLPGVALTDERLWCCLIVDGLHVDPVACTLVFAAAGRRVVAVSDSILVAGMRDTTPRLFGGEVVVADASGLGRRLDGTIAGAGILLSEGVRRMIAAGVAPELALSAATEAPAEAAQLADAGRIAPGCRADLVWWDEAWVPRRVWVGGVEVPVG